MKSIELRPYQLDAIERLRGGIRAGYKNQLLCSATGSGKGVIAASLMDECAKKGNRAVFVCDRLSLINQTSALLDSYGIAHGVIQAQHPRWRPYERIQAVSYTHLFVFVFFQFTHDVVMVGFIHGHECFVIDALWVASADRVCAGIAGAFCTESCSPRCAFRCGRWKYISICYLPYQ